MAKKRANGEGSIRKKPNGRWEGRYTQGIDPSTGRAIQKSVSARTQAECKEKLAKAIRDNRGIPVNHNEDYTVAEWCRLWFETYSKPVIRPNTAKTYENMIENHIVPAIGGVKLKRLTAIQIQKMYNDSKTKGRVQRFEKKTDTALSGSTVRRIHMVLSSALKQAVKERIIPYNPCDNCRIPPKEKKEMAIIPPEKLGVYLSEAEKYGVLPMFFLELSSGLRRGELLALQWDDLNVKDRILSVSKQVTRIDGELVVTEPKTRNSIRRVALSQLRDGFCTPSVVLSSEWMYRPLSEPPPTFTSSRDSCLSPRSSAACTAAVMSMLCTVLCCSISLVRLAAGSSPMRSGRVL